MTDRSLELNVVLTVSWMGPASKCTHPLVPCQPLTFCLQRSTTSATYYSPPIQQRYDGRTASRPSPLDNLSSPMTQCYSQLPPRCHARSTSQADQLTAPHDQSTPPGSRPYLNLATESYNHCYTSSGISSRVSGSTEGRIRDQHREYVTASETRQPSVPSPSSLKYECDYCGKGFTRPSSLKVRNCSCGFSGS